MSKNVMFLWVFTQSNEGNVEKCIVFVCFLGKVETCLFVCFRFLCVFLLSRNGEMAKGVMFVESVVFLHVFLVRPAAGAPIGVHNLLYNIYV